MCGKAKDKRTLFGGGLTTKNKRRKFHKVGSITEIVCVRTGRVSQAQGPGGPGAERIIKKKRGRQGKCSARGATLNPGQVGLTRIQGR